VQYPGNRFVITCRTQVIERVLDGMITVEIADFHEEQIRKFVQNWFSANGEHPKEAERKLEEFDNVVNKNTTLRELTITPVLLSLVCLVFQYEGEMPSDVDWLYRKGIKLLLSKWNGFKAIDGWELGTQAYQQLDTDQKEQLLIQIAAKKFENPGNFVLFEQEEISSEIAKLLQLSNRQECVNVLKAIEAQHGLLIERADELWSFSHLTFQEHFTLRWLNQLSSTELAEKISNNRWQDVIKQLIKSQKPANGLVKLIKRAIDLSVAHEPEIQKYLNWVYEKSSLASIDTQYRPQAIRAFYCALNRSPSLTSSLNLDLSLELESARAIVSNLIRTLKHDEILDIASTMTVDIALAIDHILDQNFTLASSLDRDLGHILNKGIHSKESTLCKLMKEMPSSSDEWNHFSVWWKSNGESWMTHLKQYIFEYKKVIFDWNLASNDWNLASNKEKLLRYYNAHIFLFDLINIRGAVSNSVYTEIENSFLLPYQVLQDTNLMEQIAKSMATHNQNQGYTPAIAELNEILIL